MPSIERMKNIIATYYCLDCKKEVVPRLPDALPGSKFDLNTIVLISVLFTGYNLSEKNIAKIFSTIFGLKISPATISNSLKRLKDYLQDDYKKLEEEICNAKFVHRDETGWCKNGQLNWAWVASTAETVYYTIQEKRNAKTAQSLKLNKDCVEIADAFGAYNKTGKEKQKCWAHLIRLAVKPKHYFRTKKEKEDYESFTEQLLELFHQAKKDKKTFGCSKTLRKEYDEKLFALLGKPRKRSKRWFGKNARTLKTYALNQKKHWFTFLEHEYVDPTNNRAERDIRHLVLKRRTSQQNRSDDHTESYAMQASLFMTAKYREQDYKETLHNILEHQLTGKF